MKKALAFLKSTFSEPDGTGSTARVLAGLGVLVILGCVIYVTIRTGTLPDNLDEAAVCLSTCFTGYAANQFRVAMKGVRDDQEGK